MRRSRLEGRIGKWKLEKGDVYRALGDTGLKHKMLVQGYGKRSTHIHTHRLADDLSAEG